MYPALIVSFSLHKNFILAQQTQGLILMLLILNGFIVLTLSILGPYGMKKQESDCIAVVKISFVNGLF